MTAFGESLKERLGVKVVYYTKFTDYYSEDIDPWIFRRFPVLTFDIPMATTIEESELLNPDTDRKIVSALKSGNVMISGFFEDLRLLNPSSLRAIHPRPRWVTEALTGLYGDLSACASIHVRRGDFVGLGASLGIGYYRKAMTYFPPETVFVIISDDLDWCRRNFEGCGRPVIYADRCKNRKQVLYLDLFLPSLCRAGNILSGSSFSWWGAVLNDNRDALRVMPRPWWNDADKHLYLEDTIIIETNQQR